jgi:hypothetical protein
LSRCGSRVKIQFAYSLLFPSALAFAQRALAAAASFARPAALIFRRFFGAALPPLIFAHLARCTAAMAALAALDILRRFRPLRGEEAPLSVMPASSSFSFSISSLMEIAFRNCAAVKF